MLNANNFCSFKSAAEALAGAPVHDAGGSIVEGEANEILGSTHHTAVDAETVSAPVTPTSPTSKKVKAKVWRKAKKGQRSTGCWEFDGPSLILHLLPHGMTNGMQEKTRFLESYQILNNCRYPDSIFLKML